MPILTLDRMEGAFAEKDGRNWMRTAPLLVLVLLITLAGCTDETEPERAAMDPVTQRYLALGTKALNEYRYELALAHADSAARFAPGSPDVYLLHGRVYAEMGDLIRSDSAYRQLLELDPNYPGAWNNLANNAVRRQEYTNAIRLYHEEIERNPAPIPWRGIGRAYVELGRVDSARYAFEQAVEVDSTYGPGFFSLALLHEDEGDLDKALDYARSAFRLNPEDYDFRYVMAELMVKVGRYEEALPYLLDVAEHWPWHHPSHYNLGQALARTGRPELAKRALDKAEQLRALDAQVTQQLNTVRSVPNDPLANAALGTALRMAGRYQDAMRAYRIAAHLDPANLDIQNNIANLHLVQHDTLAAIRQYEAILQQDPEFVDVWVNLGVVYAISGRRDEARQAWENALKRDAQNGRAKEYLAGLEQGGRG